MAKCTEARWLLLGEAADLFGQTYPYPQALHDILTSGQVRVVGKRDGRLSAEPIEDLLRRASQAARPSPTLSGVGEAPLVDVSIHSYANELTIAVSTYMRTWLSYPDMVRGSEKWSRREGELAALGITAPFYDSATFCEVRVERASLIDAAEAAGYPFPVGRRATRLDARHDDASTTASPKTVGYPVLRAAIKQHGPGTEDQLMKHAERSFPDKHVPRARVRQARNELYGEPKLGRPKAPER